MPLKPRSRKIVATAAVLYTLLVLFFMFLAFNRTNRLSDGFTFMFVPETTPLRFPEPTFMWLFSLGNVAAFMPFGIIIPYFFRWSFMKFAAFFLLAITFLETLQALTRLGSFDVDDIIANTLGAFIGYAAWRAGLASGRRARKWMVTVLSAIALLAGVMLVSEGWDAAIKKKEGVFQALNVAGESDALAGSFSAFTVGGESIKPQYNSYVAGSSSTSTYTIHTGHLKNIHLYANYGIPDRSAHEGRVSIFADGAMFAEFSGEYISGIETIMVPFNQIDELRIVVEGNAVLWDIGYRKMEHWWE
ncbi:VanZ family protein [Cohnella hashimotonis]|uniref:VanZ family protein n=1 Tax=Cohnella hashimotonis TaxID=2826895 RepID=A0ABT6TGW3_9BACL|nr:VanZ family protein [Cohnella hashimotonis]MDI4645989.1 VanZ family protein [Cohnella hashimotonis]